MHRPRSRGARRRARTLVAAAVAALGACAGPLADGAAARPYIVTACGGSSAGHALTFARSSERMDGANLCPVTRSADVHRGLVAHPGYEREPLRLDDHARWTFAAPAGTTISGLQVRHHGFRAAGSWYRVGLFRGNGDALGTSCPAGSEACRFGVADPTRGTTTFGDLRETSVSWEIRCRREAACEGSRSGPVYPAGIRIYQLAVTVEDPAAPTVDGLGGGLWSGGWLRGRQTVTYDARDASGIRRRAFVVDGRVLSTLDDPCDFARARPCTDRVDATATLDTSGLADGAHTVRLDVADAAGNVRAVSRTVHTDNTAPGRPGDPVVAGGSGWRRANAFDLTWTNPSQGSGAPVAAAHWSACPLAGTSGSCVGGTVRGTGVRSVSGLQLPAPGEWEWKVRLEDAAGNAVASAFSDPVTLRWDPAVPGRATVVEPAGWLSRVEADAYVQRFALGTGEARPRSGIAGYSVTVDRAGSPDETVEARARADATAELPLRGLAEGRHAVRARTVSGAGVGAATTGAAEVRVDRTPPSAGLVEDPGTAWRPGPVELVLSGTDQEGLSGMTPAPDGRPVEEGAYVEWRVGGAAPVRVRGDRAVVRVEDEGVHTVVWRAVDAAGNPSAERSLQVRIDRTPPRGGVQDAHDGWVPRGRVRLAADDALSGMTAAPADRPAEEGGRVLVRVDDGPERVVRGGIASVDVPEQGEHAVTYRFADRAGNLSAPATVRVRVDAVRPTVAVGGAPDAAAWQRAPVRLAVRGADDRSGVRALAVRVDGGRERLVARSATTVTVGSDGRHLVSVAAVDRAGNRSPERAVAFRIDRTAPSGLAVAPSHPDDPAAITSPVRDRTSGVAGGTVEVRRGADAWRALPTRLTRGRLVARVDDARLPAGVYEVRVTARDAAGNVARSGRGADGRPARLRLPLRVGTTLRVAPVGVRCASACRGSRSGSPVRVPPGRRLTLRGRLTDLAGAPVAGAPVLVAEQVPGDVERPAGRARTHADGRFTVELPAGPSRVVRFRFGGDARRLPATGEQAVRVPARATLRASRRTARNGGTVRFDGRLRGGHVPRGGKLVALQAHFNGRWRTFATPRTDARGRWTFRYRFSATTRPVVYRFRAVVPEEASYPYEAARSREVRVAVRP